jgi:hypothetical protein
MEAKPPATPNGFGVDPYERRSAERRTEQVAPANVEVDVERRMRDRRDESAFTRRHDKRERRRIESY